MPKCQIGLALNCLFYDHFCWQLWTHKWNLSIDFTRQGMEMGLGEIAFASEYSGLYSSLCNQLWYVTVATIIFNAFIRARFWQPDSPMNSTVQEVHLWRQKEAVFYWVSLEPVLPNVRVLSNMLFTTEWLYFWGDVIRLYRAGSADKTHTIGPLDMLCESGHVWLGLRRKGAWRGITSRRFGTR